MKSKIHYFGILAALLLMASPVMAADLNVQEGMVKFVEEMGIVSFFVGEGWKNALMIVIGCFLLYLAI